MRKSLKTSAPIQVLRISQKTGTPPQVLRTESKDRRSTTSIENKPKNRRIIISIEKKLSLTIVETKCKLVQSTDKNLAYTCYVQSREGNGDNLKTYVYR